MVWRLLRESTMHDTESHIWRINRFTRTAERANDDVAKIRSLSQTGKDFNDGCSN